MSRFRLAVMSGICIAGSLPAVAEDLSAATSKSARNPAAKSRPVKLAPSKGHGLNDVRFTNPYAPPVDAGTATDLPPSQKVAPTDPKGGVSFTYKWHATNDPVDKYNECVRQSVPGGPGDTFMGGLKLGF